MSDGTPPPQLSSDNIEVINEETGEDFSDSTEGGTRSEPGLPDDIKLLTVFVLDFSESIFKANVQDMIQRGVDNYLKALMVESHDDDDDLTTIKQNHYIAIVQLGRTQEVDVVLEFTNDPTIIGQTVDNMMATGGLGTTNLYEGFILGINTAENEEVTAELVERAVVLITDGTHQAGNEDTLRNQALHVKEQSTIDIFTIGVEGDYDEEKVRELASRQEHFYETTVEGVADKFQNIAAGIVELAKRNYVVGICTPVDIGNPTLTIKVSTGGLSATETVAYSTRTLDGNTTDCDPDQVAEGEGTAMPHVEQAHTESGSLSDFAAEGPKCAELGSNLGEKDAACWEEIQSQPGCYIWNEHYHSDRIADWTGGCSGDTAHGRGSFSLSSGSEHEASTASGSFMHGKQNGHWVIRYDDGLVSEGPFVDGKWHGHWVNRWGDGRRSEGLRVYGKRDGLWVTGFADGSVIEYEYRNGSREGQSGVYQTADGSRYPGRWSDGCFRDADGYVWVRFEECRS